MPIHVNTNPSVKIACGFVCFFLFFVFFVILQKGEDQIMQRMICCRNETESRGECTDIIFQDTIQRLLPLAGPFTVSLNTQRYRRLFIKR
jgi:hypothetical protein